MDMNCIDHFDGCSFIYEDDHTTITFEYVMDPEEYRTHEPYPSHEEWGPDNYQNIRTWLDGVTIDEENKPLVADVLHALGGLQHSASYNMPAGKGQPTETVVNVRTMGPGFIGRAPPLASTEFLANIVVVAILLLFAPGFTLLAAGVFVTSRVAERWAGHD